METAVWDNLGVAVALEQISPRAPPTQVPEDCPGELLWSALLRGMWWE